MIGARRRPVSLFSLLHLPILCLSLLVIREPVSRRIAQRRPADNSSPPGVQGIEDRGGAFHILTMRLIHAIAASALLGAAAGAVRERIPMHKRFSYDVLINDFSYLGMLAKRDECSDAFGSNARNSNCSPDFTLCCTGLTKTSWNSYP